MVLAKIVILLSGIVLGKKEEDMDYSYWLGPDYKAKYRKIKRTSTVVTNHVSWIDTPVIMINTIVAITLDKGLEKAPVLGPMAKMTDGLFLPRGGTNE